MLNLGATQQAHRGTDPEGVNLGDEVQAQLLRILNLGGAHRSVMSTAPCAIVAMTRRGR